MSKEFVKSKNALVVNLYGEIDQYAAAELKGRIDIEIESSLKRNLIFNLEKVTLMDSSGIGLIVGRYKAVSALGGVMALCSASPSVKKMIDLSGIGKIIKHYETVDDADRSFKQIYTSERNENK